MDVAVCCVVLSGLSFFFFFGWSVKQLDCSILLFQQFLLQTPWYWDWGGGGGIEGRSRHSVWEEMIKGERVGSGSFLDRKQGSLLSRYQDWLQPQGADQRDAPCFHFILFVAKGPRLHPLHWNCSHQLSANTTRVSNPRLIKNNNK